MKAITCPQCGATIEHVLETSTIIDCEYCGARIMMDRAEEASKPPLPAQETSPITYEPQDADNSPFRIVATLITLIVIVPVFIAVAFIAKPKKREPVRYNDKPVTYSTPSSTPSSWSFTADKNTKQLPNVNYQPRVAWDGPNDMEYFDDPQVDISSVADLTSEEVKNTVFKNRVVKLRVVINTEGEIDDVETISGHPLLVAAATESAKRSIFRSRPKPTTRVLTYTFRLLKD